MIEIEFAEPNESHCECCDGITVNLTRFVNRDGNAWAIYYAAFSPQHPENRLTGIISLGGWGEDEIPEYRVAFAFELWTYENSFQIGITDARESPWCDVRIIGKKLSREEGLAHPWINDVFHITDHMTADDPVIREFFAEETVH